MRVLVVCANPINKSGSTRQFYTYFDDKKSFQLAQIFTNDHTIDKEMCGLFYNITDEMLVKNILGKKQQAITQNTKNISNKSSTKNASRFFKFLKSIGKKEFPFVQLLRKLLWNKKRWLSEDLLNWVKDFNPDVIFYHNSNAFFQGDIAYTLAKKLGIKIILEISDDYYFNSHFSLSPFYFIYRHKYKKVFKKQILDANGIFFISDKMKEKYENYFNVKGETIHISSELEESNFNISKCENNGFDTIRYFGNIGLKRWKTIAQLSKVLEKQKNDTTIEVYCPKIGNSKVDKLNKLKNVKYCGFLEYENLREKMVSSSYLLIVESFSKSLLADTRYSLSTKLADYLKTGVPIIALGPSGSGTIDFLIKNDLAYVSTSKKEICNMLRRISTQTSNALIMNSLKIASELFNQKDNANKAKKYIFKIVTES